jgi:phosphonate transport system substrate-binding protein
MATGMMLRFALPPSLPAAAVETVLTHGAMLREALAVASGVVVDVVIPRDYDALRLAVLTGAVDAALAPPVVCAQLVATRVPVPLQVVRRGHTAFASALVVRRGCRAYLVPRRLRAAWVDPLSMCGHLLPRAHLRAGRHRLDGFFVDEQFHGSYGAALQAVVDGRADTAGVHVLPGGEGLAESLEVHLPGAASQLTALAVTAAVPGDAIAVLPSGRPLLSGLARLPVDVMRTVFRADGFASAGAGAFSALATVISPES